MDLFSPDERKNTEHISENQKHVKQTNKDFLTFFNFY
jgi:hypothetical protein